MVIGDSSTISGLSIHIRTCLVARMDRICQSSLLNNVMVKCQIGLGHIMQVPHQLSFS